MAISFNILSWWQQRKENQAQALSFYKDVIKAARHPNLFKDHRFRDTAEGRFESLALHLFLFYERTHRDPLLNRFSRPMANLVTKDLEANLREMGAGDMYIGKKVKKTTLNLYSRLDSYWGYFHLSDDRAKQKTDEDRQELLRRTIYGDYQDEDITQGMKDGIAFFMRYILSAQEGLNEQPSDAMIKNGPQFPNPAT